MFASDLSSIHVTSDAFPRFKTSCVGCIFFNNYESKQTRLNSFFSPFPVRGDERIIRSCGFEVYKKDCYKTVLEEYNTYVCQCDTDGCNGASGLATSTAAAFALALAVAVRNNMAL